MPSSRRSIALLALAAALLTACNGVAGPAATSAPPAMTSTVPAWHFPEVPRVTVAEAKAALDSGSAVFLDVRTIQDYDDQHIPGAAHVFFQEIEEHVGELDKADWIITYCN